MLSADFLHLEKEVEMVNACADIFHLDIMDGTFVPNISFGFPVVEAIARKATKPMDVHLMIVHPEKYIPRFADAGASYISFHLEAAEADGSDPAEILRMIRSRGVKAGLVINPDIPVPKLFPYLEETDFILPCEMIQQDRRDRFQEEHQEIEAAGLSDSIHVRGADGIIRIEAGGQGPEEHRAQRGRKPVVPRMEEKHIMHDGHQMKPGKDQHGDGNRIPQAPQPGPGKEENEQGIQQNQLHRLGKQDNEPQPTKNRVFRAEAFLDGFFHARLSRFFPGRYLKTREKNRLSLIT